MELEIPNWTIAMLAPVGSALGAYIGVKVKIGKLETRVDDIKEDVGTLLEKSDTQGNAVHAHGILLEHHERRIGKLEA